MEQLPPGICIDCNQWAGRIIPAWWLRAEDGTAGGGLCSPCCEVYSAAEDAKIPDRRR